ncbi:hypothetical protein V1522DRAFT_393787 [Lipomyces starkeyi]
MSLSFMFYLVSHEPDNLSLQGFNSQESRQYQTSSGGTYSSLGGHSVAAPTEHATSKFGPMRWFCRQKLASLKFTENAIPPAGSVLSDTEEQSSTWAFHVLEFGAKAKQEVYARTLTALIDLLEVAAEAITDIAWEIFEFVIEFDWLVMTKVRDFMNPNIPFLGAFYSWAKNGRILTVLDLASTFPVKSRQLTHDPVNSPSRVFGGWSVFGMYGGFGAFINAICKINETFAVTENRKAKQSHLPYKQFLIFVRGADLIEVSKYVDNELQGACATMSVGLALGIVEYSLITEGDDPTCAGWVSFSEAVCGDLKLFSEAIAYSNLKSSSPGLLGGYGHIPDLLPSNGYAVKQSYPLHRNPPLSMLPPN